MKKITTIIILACNLALQVNAQDNYLWATGSTVGSYYNIANFYGNNYMNPWPYSRTTMIPIVDGGISGTWESMESSIASQLQSTGVKEDGTIWFWIKNASPDKSAKPIQFGTDTDWKQGAIANGSQGLKNNGTLWFLPSSVTAPQQWGTDSDWDTIVGWKVEYMLVIKTNGTLWKLESNINGEPMNINQVGTDADWRTAKISTNGTLTYAIKNNGTLWEYDEDADLFVQEGTDSDWKDITESGYIAIKTNGTIWGKGSNMDGVLGMGNNNQVFYEFTQIGTDTDWKHISSRDLNTYAIKTDSTLWAWGDNSAYQMANGTNTNVYVPTQIGEDHSWLDVSATKSGAFALRTYGYAGPGGGSSVGINSLEQGNLKAYPNPGTNSLVLNNQKGWNGFEVTFTSVDGKEVSLNSTQKSATDMEFNTESLVAGIYIIRLSSPEGTALVRWVKK